jgi:hypothetical protein
MPTTSLDSVVATTEWGAVEGDSKQQNTPAMAQRHVTVATFSVTAWKKNHPTNTNSYAMFRLPGWAHKY